MLKKRQVVMLPTNEKASKLVLNNEGKLWINPEYSIKSGLAHPQHLYFLSDEEIKEGDWFLHESHGKKTVAKCEKIVGKSIVINKAESSCWIDYSKKIITTTDSSLTVKHHPQGQQMYLLPQPSQSFLEIFVREYNKGNMIKEVMVEYEISDNWLKENPPFSGPYPEPRKKDYTLKVNPKDNTITIKRVKESWSREEIKEIVRKFATDVYQDKVEHPSFYRKISDLWIEQNL